MKKNRWLLAIFILIGLLAGSLAARSLQSVEALKALTRTARLTWSPAADLVVLSYSFTLHINVSLLSIAGVLLAIWLYRKM